MNFWFTMHYHNFKANEILQLFYMLTMYVIFAHAYRYQENAFTAM